MTEFLQGRGPIVQRTKSFLIIVKIGEYNFRQAPTSFFGRSISIFLCRGGGGDVSVASKRAITSSKRKALSKLQNSFDFSLDFKRVDSLFDIATADIEDIELVLGSPVT